MSDILYGMVFIISVDNFHIDYSYLTNIYRKVFIFYLIWNSHLMVFYFSDPVDSNTP